MAQSRFTSEQYMSDRFVESASAVLFRLSTQEICILYQQRRDEFLLAKGRRNCGESCPDAAIREVKEESGYSAYLLPVTMRTRAPPAIEDQQHDDTPRELEDICEPISLQIRRLAEDNVKLIWWYVAAIDENIPRTPQDAADVEKFMAEFYEYDEVLDKLTFQMDREVVKKAIEIVRTTKL